MHHDEEEWEQDEAWLEARARRRSTRDDDEEASTAPAEQPVQVPLEQELPGSVYFIPHDIWDFPTHNPKDRPGVCVGCDLPTRWTWLFRGVDAHSPVTKSYEVILVEPTKPNGLEKQTAFLVEPYPVRLHRLLTFHAPPSLIGRLETVYFQPIHTRFLDIVRANRREEP
jgi:hypothetical protein